jgi:hypothetical protein
MEACSVPDKKGAGGASVLRLVVQTRDMDAAVPARWSGAWMAAALIGDGRQQGNHQTSTTPVLAHALHGTRHTAHISSTRPIAPPASSVPAATTRTLLPASSTTSTTAVSLEAPTTPCHIPRTPYHNVDQSATAVPARRSHQALAA